MIRGNDPILLTPGPLTTSLRTKQAMLNDWGSWDAAFNAITASLRKDLVDIVGGGSEYTCVPLQGSGTFSVEAAIGTLVPRAGRVLVPNTGTAGLPVFSTIEENGQHYFTVQYVRLRENAPTYVAKWSETLAPGSFVAMNGSMTTDWIDASWQRVTIKQPIDPATNKRRFGIVEVTMP